MVIEQSLGLVIQNKTGNMPAELLPSVWNRKRGLPFPCPLQISSVAAGPLPCVVEIDNGRHAPLSDFRHEPVQSLEKCLVIHTRLFLQCRRHFVRSPVWTVCPGKHPQIGDAQRFEGIQLCTEPLQIAALPGRSQNRPVPEIGPDEIHLFVALEKFPVFHPVKFRLPPASAQGGGQSHRKQCSHTSENCISAHILVCLYFLIP